MWVRIWETDQFLLGVKIRLIGIIRTRVLNLIFHSIIIEFHIGNETLISVLPNR